ncbi:MAG: hypothetical protein QOE73_1188 [Verrucomicrobiota bacterium]
MWSSKAKHPSREDVKTLLDSIYKDSVSGLRDLAGAHRRDVLQLCPCERGTETQVDDYYDNGCAGEWDHLKREMPWKSPSSRRHLTS